MDTSTATIERVVGVGLGGVTWLYNSEVVEVTQLDTSYKAHFLLGPEAQSFSGFEMRWGYH